MKITHAVLLCAMLTSSVYLGAAAPAFSASPASFGPCITSPSYSGKMQPFVNGCSHVVTGTITYVGGSMAVTWKANETKYFDVTVYSGLSMASEN